MLNSCLWIKNTCGDGNCGYWATLRSLKNIRDQNSNQGIGNRELVIPDGFNPLLPTRADYQLMHHLRIPVSAMDKEETLKDLLYPAYANFARAFGIPQDQPVTLNNFQVQSNILQAIAAPSPSSGNNAQRQYLIDLRDHIDSCLRHLDVCDRSMALTEYAPADLWMTERQYPYIARAVKLPFLVVYHNPYGNADDIRYQLFQADGTQVNQNTDVTFLKEFLQNNPNTVKIYLVRGGGHFKAIVERP
jgi:hypothetical protein